VSSLAAAWQAALAAEHRAAFAYGLAGAQLHGTADIALVIACSDAHEQLRDSISATMTADGLTPIPPAADYPDLYPVTTGAQARAVAVRVEQDCAAAWRFLYAAAASATGIQATELRSTAQSSLTASAVRATKWRRIVRPSAATVAFPGLS
jgi:hypothetical protein